MIWPYCAEGALNRNHSIDHGKVICQMLPCGLWNCEKPDRPSVIRRDRSTLAFLCCMHRFFPSYWVVHFHVRFFFCSYQSSDWLWRLPPKWPNFGGV